MLRLDGYDKCLIGTTEAWDSSGHRPVRLVYDGNKILRQLVARGMSHEEAQEWIDFNIEGAYVGPHTPIIVWHHTMAEVGQMLENEEELESELFAVPRETGG